MKLIRISGIDIGLHYSWVIIALLITLSLAGHFQEMHSEWTGTVIWGSAILMSLLFLAALVAHELAHAAMARARGFAGPVDHALFALGGVSQIEKRLAIPTEF